MASLKPGVELLSEDLGDGPLVRRRGFYQIRLRMWLRRGDPIRWSEPWGVTGHSRLEDDGATLVAVLPLDRVSLFAGLFYGLQGMRVGGTRRLQIAPHLGYGEDGLPGLIPPNALLTAEVTVLAAQSLNDLTQ